MPQAAKCTSCGANIEVDENQDAGVCPYCHSAYITDKAIKNYNNTNNTTNNASTIVNNYYTAQPQSDVVKVRNQVMIVPPRPKINAGLAILGCIFYIIPGIIYIGYVTNKQREWDEKYSKK